MGRTRKQASGRFPLALIWPTGLVLLVGVLAFFQYKWLGQVSESERERLRTTLNQRAREFADDFDRDIGRAYASLQFNAEGVQAKDWESFAKRYDSWKESARYPQLIRNIFITPEPDAASSLLQFDPGARTFRAAEWPPELDPVRQRLHTSTERVTAPPPGLPGAIKFMAMGGTPIVASVPAILVPIQATQHVADVPRGSTFTFRVGPSYVVLELDREFMVNTMLPALVARHFEIDDYHVAITDQRTPDTPLYTKGLAAGTAIRAKDADAAMSFFNVRVDGLRDILTTMRGQTSVGFMTSAPAATLTPEATGRFSIVVQQDRPRGDTTRVPADRATAELMSVQQRAGAEILARGFNVQYTGGAWQIVLQHPAGSLEAAVTRARMRNLSLSFGVLAVLAAGVFLISINAERARRLAAQQMDFVATVSHELRTPLAVIRSAAQNLSAGVVHEPAQARRYGELIDAEGRRLTDMVEQVLTYAGMSDGNRPATTSPTDIAWLTKDVVSSCDSLIRDAGFTVEVTAADGIPEVPLDEGSYRRALTNLVVNALKYGADGKWLGIDLRMGDRSGKPEVQVSVADRGRGVDPPDRAHIFEAFYRGQYAKDQQIHGNGLGLSLVKGIAEAHGGRVTLTSTPGAGATFTLHLPA